MKNSPKKSNIPNYENIRAALKITNGKVFSCVFVKRTTGEIREMTARLGVKKYLKGGALSYDPKTCNLIPVFDMVKGAYRSISIEGIKEIKIEGKTYKFD